MARVTITALLMLLSIAGQLHFGLSLRTGAPSLACLGMRPLHGLHRAKPASASQFFVSQSSLSYTPGQNISVDIITHSNERYFRGFMVQAYNPATGAQIGQFVGGPDYRTIDSCSSATHRNNLNKKKVTLIWVPPNVDNGVNPLSETAAIGNEWLGLHSPITMSVRTRKRQLDAHQPNPIDPHSPVASSMHPSVSPTGPIVHNSTLHQVRFKATIVVTYEEFYTGFESSDQRFDKFDFAPHALASSSVAIA